ncbi:MAG TPA: hypothetical protein DG757_01570 [Bacillus sp. (in: Bacteria)]|nr:hypothetical protein [Bacillus sp. (in: firmicutes)]
MKRYWKIISLCVLTVLILGFFYIQSGLAAKEDIKVEFEKVSGNQAELEKILFYGDYEIGNIYQSLHFTNQETIDINQLSLLQSLNRELSSPYYKKLVKEYRSFMRGKIFTTNSFYEDEKILAYAELDYQSAKKSSFDIDVLDKKSGETTSIKLDLPEKEKYNWADVSEVQAIDGKLKVFVRGFQVTGTSEINLYTFDIDKEKLEENEVLLSTSEKENNWSDIRMINSYQSSGYERYILFNIETQQVETYEDESSMEMKDNLETANKELIIYDIETGKTNKMVTDDEMIGFLDAASVYDSTLFIPIQVENRFEINQYDIEKQVWGKKITFDVPVSKDEASSGPYMKLMNGKFYLIHAAKNEHTLLIADVATGKVLYEGVLTVKKDGVEQSDYRLYIHEMETVQ